MSIFDLKSDIEKGDTKAIVHSLSILRSITNFELIGVGAVGILLLFPGVLDEMLAGIIMVSALISLAILRRSFRANRGKILELIEKSRVKGDLSEEDHKQAVVDLNTLTVEK
ncbi:MAG: hypothetical protein AAGH43_01150 [Pseudomonadota bacterium]